MKKTMVYLPEEVHEGLRRLAFEHKTSMAELVRRAVDAVYGETIEDIRDMEEEVAAWRADPSPSIPLEDWVAEHKLDVPTRASSARKARA